MELWKALKHSPGATATGDGITGDHYTAYSGKDRSYAEIWKNMRFLERVVPPQVVHGVHWKPEMGAMFV